MTKAEALSLYFSSTRPGGLGNEDIWVCRCASEDDAWGTPVNLGATINTGFSERGTGLSRDEHFIFLVTNRPGGFGGLDIWVSWRANTHDDFGWQQPVNLGAGVNTPSNEADPSYVDNSETGTLKLYFASNRPAGLGAYDIYVSELAASGSFGQATLVHELSSPQVDLRAAFRHDELEVFLSSNREGGSPEDTDLWVSTRATVHDVWAAPVNLGPLVNSVFSDSFPSLSSDGQTLFFSSTRNRPDSPGRFDLYVSTRSRLGPPN